MNPNLEFFMIQSLPSHLGRLSVLLSALSVLVLAAPVQAADWIHWRGPEQNGLSREKNLPDSIDPDMGAKGNVVWKAPIGGRAAPLVMGGRIYVFQGTGAGLLE